MSLEIRLSDRVPPVLLAWALERVRRELASLELDRPPAYLAGEVEQRLWRYAAGLARAEVERFERQAVLLDDQLSLVRALRRTLGRLAHTRRTLDLAIFEHRNDAWPGRS
jgi:hypothetical protein